MFDLGQQGGKSVRGQRRLQVQLNVASLSFRQDLAKAIQHDGGFCRGFDPRSIDKGQNHALNAKQSATAKKLANVVQGGRFAS